MKVEILTVLDCPSRLPARKLVESVAAAEGIGVEISEITVRDEAMARDLHFPGSPTIRIEGRDVEAIASDPALSCRLYREAQGRTTGLPRLEAIRRLLRERPGELR